MSAVEKASSIDLCHDLVSLLEQIVSQLQKHGWTEDSDRAFTKPAEATNCRCDLKIPRTIGTSISSHLISMERPGHPFIVLLLYVLVFFFSLRIIHV